MNKVGELNLIALRHILILGSGYPREYLQDVSVSLVLLHLLLLVEALLDHLVDI
jgi:hypothetical protein